MAQSKEGERGSRKCRNCSAQRESRTRGQKKPKPSFRKDETEGGKKERERGRREKKRGGFNRGTDTGFFFFSGRETFPSLLSDHSL